MGGTCRLATALWVAASSGPDWLLAGAVCYTSGVAFFLMDSRVKFAHLSWHVFVVAGFVWHFVAIVLQAADSTACAVASKIAARTGTY